MRGKKTDSALEAARKEELALGGAQKQKSQTQYERALKNGDTIDMDEVPELESTGYKGAKAQNDIFDVDDIEVGLESEEEEEEVGGVSGCEHVCYGEADPV